MEDRRGGEGVDGGGLLEYRSRGLWGAVGATVVAGGPRGDVDFGWGIGPDKRSGWRWPRLFILGVYRSGYH